MQTKKCKYCTSENITAATHCRRCNRWLGPDASSPTLNASPLFRSWAVRASLVAVVAAMAYVVPYMLSAFEPNASRMPAASPPTETKPSNVSTSTVPVMPVRSRFLNEIEKRERNRDTQKANAVQKTTEITPVKTEATNKRNERIAKTNGRVKNP